MGGARRYFLAFSVERHHLPGAEHMLIRKKLTFLVFLMPFVGNVAASGLHLSGDIAAGQRLHQARCSGCHVQQFGGDGSGVYLRTPRRVTNVQELVAFSNRLQHFNRKMDPNLQLDEIQMGNIIAYINKYYYHFY